MHIAQVLLHRGIGGAEALVASLNVEFRDRGHTVSTFYVNEGRPTGRFSRFRRLQQHIRTEQPDVLFAHSALPAVFTRAATPRPVVSVLHSAVDDFETASLRVAERLLRLRNTAAIVAVSERQRDQYVARFGERLPVVVISNGIRPGIIRRIRRPNETLRVSTLARVAAQKDPGTWLAVAATLKDSDGLVMQWYGPDDPAIGLENAAALLPGPVSFLGPTEDVIGALDETDILFHPSRREAHPIALLEAAAAGIPILCTPEVAETMPDDVPLRTFPVGDADAARRSLLAVRDDLQRLGEMAFAAAPTVQTRFGSGECADHYLELAAKLSGDGRALA